MNSQCSNPEVQDNICDDPFNQYINCLQVIFCVFVYYYVIIGMTQVLWRNVNLSKKSMKSVLILGSKINF